MTYIPGQECNIKTTSNNIVDVIQKNSASQLGHTSGIYYVLCVSGSLICSCVLLPHCVFDWDNDQFPVAHTHRTRTGTDLGDMHGPGPETPVLAPGGSDYSAGWHWGQIHHPGEIMHGHQNCSTECHQEQLEGLGFKCMW